MVKLMMLTCSVNRQQGNHTAGVYRRHHGDIGQRQDQTGLAGLFGVPVSESFPVPQGKIQTPAADIGIQQACPRGTLQETMLSLHI